MTTALGGALNRPLGLAIAPNGNVLTVNGGDGRIIEIAPSGHCGAGQHRKFRIT